MQRKRSVKLLNRKGAIAFFLFSASFYSAQFMNGLNRIYMQEGEKINLPREYNFFVNEQKKNSQEIFFKNLQHSDGNGGSFNSLDLIFFENKKYDFLKTGFVIVPEINSKLMGKPISTVPVRATGTWKAPKGTVDFDTYNPRNNTTNFFYMKFFGNITDEQLLAHFFNMKVANFNSKIDNSVQFIRDINKANKIQINENFDSESPGLLTRLCKEINSKMPDSDCNFAPYKAYLANPDEDKTRKNLDDFYGSIWNNGVDDVTNEYILPRGSIDLPQKALKLVLPNQFFYGKSKNDQSDVFFYINNIQHNLTYDFKLKTYVFIFKITPFADSLSSDFKFISSYHNTLKGKQEVGEIEVKKNEIKNIELLLYPDRMEVQVYFKGNDNRFDYHYKLKNIFNIKKNNQ